MRITDFVTLPASVQTAIYFLTCTSILGTVAAVFDPKIAGIVGAGIVGVCVVIGLFILLRQWLEKRRAASMTSELVRATGGGQLGANAAKLDELRTAFLEGIAKFGDKGNIYKVPWYVIVGEPGGGKTEAIRHCGVRFPPGLHEKGTEQLGVGGTRNMNWWFTDEAVFLDTAGRLMFEDLAPGANNEWQEFLRLLGRNRPNCPINGLLLVIPADALIKDTDAELDRKGNKIAAQFEVIQKTLDIRFPVFVVVTKSDLLSGFREFFDDFADAQSVNQMLGWSNPAERDAPFAPERVTDHLASVVERIKRRRLSLLHDPVPREEQRRADEVDALFSLPQSIELIAPRLREYLQRIFVAGPFSPKPLFLRGIYFTSSMREGSVLDQELALALGLRTDDLKEMRAWEKERAYFLRDIFTDKVFREKGLVTRATNTKKQLRTRSLILWGSGTALALAFAGFSLYSARQFADSIARHRNLWNAATKAEDWVAKKNAAGREVDVQWKPIVAPMTPGDTVATFRGSEPSVLVGSEHQPLLTYYKLLREAAKEPIEAGWVYRLPVRAANLDENRLRAQRIVFEASAVYPLVEAARHRMLQKNVESAGDVKDDDSHFWIEAHALEALLRIESDRVTGKRSEPDVIVKPLLHYTAAKADPVDEKAREALRSEYVEVYSHNPTGQWVPKHLGWSSASLLANAPIQAGLDRLEILAKRTVSTQRKSAEKIKGLRDELTKFRLKEHALKTAALELNPDAKTKENLTDGLADLSVIKEAIDVWFRSNGDANGEEISMLADYKRLVADSSGKSEANFQKLRAAVQPLVEHPTEKLFKEVDDKLVGAQKNASDQVAQFFNEDDQKKLSELDGYLEKPDGNEQRIYALRYETYRTVADLAVKEDNLVNLIGTQWQTYGAVRNQIATARSLVEKRQQWLTPKGMKEAPSLTDPCNALLKFAEDERLGKLSTAYLKESARKFEDNFYHPFVDTPDKGSSANARSLIEQWKDDLRSPEFLQLPQGTPARGRLSSFFPDLDAMLKAADGWQAAENHNNAAKRAYDEALAAFSVSVQFLRQEPYTYHYVRGDYVWGGGKPSWPDVGRGGMSFQVSDINKYPKDAGSVPTATPAESRDVRVGHTTLWFKVTHDGQIPPKPVLMTSRDVPPKKSTILAKLKVPDDRPAAGQPLDSGATAPGLSKPTGSKPKSAPVTTKKTTNSTGKGKKRK